MTLLPQALRPKAQSYPTQEYDSTINSEIFCRSDISTPPMGISTTDSWQPTSDVGTLDSDDPRRIYNTSSPSYTSTAPRRQKRKLSLGRYLSKKAAEL